MRRAMLLPILLLAACKDEPDFDTRYEAAAGEIEARAKAMEADIAEARAARAAADGKPASGLPPAADPAKSAASSGE